MTPARRGAAVTAPFLTIVAGSTSPVGYELSSQPPSTGPISPRSPVPLPSPSALFIPNPFEPAIQEQGKGPEHDRAVIRRNELIQLGLAVDETLASNRAYQGAIIAKMSELAEIVQRTKDLQELTLEYQQTINAPRSVSIMAPYTQQVILPWFKHFHSKDLPPNPDGEMRERYLTAIRHVPWTKPERASLKSEVIEQNNRGVAALAVSSGKDVTEQLASYDSTFFVESVDMLDWDRIALVITRRTAAECRIQWLQNDHPSINSAKWKPAELTRLYEIAERAKERDWGAIARELGTRRTARDCLKMYRRRNGQRKEWSPDENERLTEAVAMYGLSWQAVSLHVGRNVTQCTARWSKTMQPTIARGKWSAQEDAALIAAVKALGPSWKRVSPRVKGRTDAQCRERWCNVLNPDLLPGSIWAEEEEERLVRMHEVEGKSFSQIANTFKGARTDNHCRMHYQNLQRAKGPVKRVATTAEKSAANKARKLARQEAAREGTASSGDGATDAENAVVGPSQVSAQAQAHEQMGAGEDATPPSPSPSLSTTPVSRARKRRPPASTATPAAKKRAKAIPRGAVVEPIFVDFLPASPPSVSAPLPVEQGVRGFEVSMEPETEQLGSVRRSSRSKKGVVKVLHGY